MKLFCLTLILTSILALIARIIKEPDNKPNVIISAFIVIILVLISGLRCNIGDTESYINLYNLVGTGVDLSGYEPGFIYILAVLKKISSDPQFMIFTLAMITNAINIWTIRKYSKVFELEIFTYIAAGYFLITMNGVRQALVAAILFACTNLIINNKFKIYLPIVLILSTIHTSALIMIPIYFLVKTEAWSEKMIKIIALSSIGFLLFQPLMTVVFNLIDGTRYSSYEEVIMSTGNGANIIRVIIAAVPVILSYIKRDELKEAWPESNLFVNMSVINLIIMVFSLFNWIFARFSFYFQIYTFILLPFIIVKLFEKKERGLVYYGFIVCYLLFFLIEENGLIYKSNFIGVF